MTDLDACRNRHPARRAKGLAAVSAVDDPNGLLPADRRDVFAVVQAAYHVTGADLIGSARGKPFDRARAAAARMLHDECDISWETVADILRRDKTNVRAIARNVDPALLEILHRRLWNGTAP